ncbi:hypothetical protein LMG33818_001598 [Halomonadaceae bacterium LMG 33818]|uniref:class I SAM-dependent methyltransferase n=1 Tax=Cernens ardua TaxID=3402176 RepID=UPI003EDC83FD
MDTTSLFTDVAGAYATFRPSYPDYIYRVLQSFVSPPADALDIAAGTGIFSMGLNKAGYNVTAIEPNVGMRAELEKANKSASIRVIEGTAESTGVLDNSVDLITMAQAFHWVDPKATRAEFKRIGTNSCQTAIVWNSRNFSETDFMKAYKSLLDNFAPNYKRMKVHWSHLDRRVEDFFQNKYEYYDASNIISINEDEMIGNLLSLSYAPPKGTIEQKLFIQKAKEIFNKYQSNGKVPFDLTTRLYIGNLK